MYTIKGKKVYSFDKEISHADANSFISLSDNFGLDKNHVFFQSSIIEGIEKEGLQVLGPLVIRDEIDVFYIGNPIKCGISELLVLEHNYITSEKGAYFQGRKIQASVDLKTFKVLDEHYSRDINHIYYTSGEFNADNSSFEIMGSNYGRDKNHIYHGNTILQSALRDSFEIIPHEDYMNYAKDAQNVFINEGRIINADPRSFEALEETFSKDKHRVYCYGEELNEADPASFEVISSGVHSSHYIVPYKFSKDKKNVYYDDQILCSPPKDFAVIEFPYYLYKKKIWSVYRNKHIKHLKRDSMEILNHLWIKDHKYVYLLNKKRTDLDHKSFTLVGDGYAKDKSKVFYESLEIPHIDAASFQSLGKLISRDKNNLFYMNEMIEGSEPNSFENLMENFFEDNKQVYYLDPHYDVFADVEGADPDSFDIINKPFFKDKDHVFYMTEIIEGADPVSFKCLDYIYAQDKNHIYLGDEILCDNSDLNFTIFNSDLAIDDKYLYQEENKIAIDRASFQVIDEYNCKDKNQVIYRGRCIAEADPHSFEIINKIFNKDKNHIYTGSILLPINVKESVFIEDIYCMDHEKVFFINEQLVGADPRSFVPLEGHFSKDNNLVFYRDVLIDGADAESFEVMSYGECRDKTHRYFFRNGKVHREELTKSTKN